MPSVPDTFDGTWQGAAEFEVQFGLRLKRLEDFVAARVRDHASAVG